ncbi:tetratricopeptide repeat protein [Archaeoglobus veneficus]|uniref:Tetratricopeptide TPR_1 repeat-containing protein n=1 Tax=Archaeoglobus veneficus (strain DSM 11195 / SNP6) TaxID=693661 RepID=F2KNS7_ARCVS|nr:tetratricopeptide repeat protein [Archaeoglobus veneficus]AEA47404.1 Tetratricopeptide TPR_1 repeat-containing protein [Archaeoglobus veneficus SNP6]
MEENVENKCMLKAGVRAIANELIIRNEDKLGDEADSLRAIKDPDEALEKVIEKLAGDNAFSMLKDFALLGEADYELLKDTFSEKYPVDVVDRLIEAGLLERRGDIVRFTIKALRDEIGEGDHSLAAKYWKKRMDKFGRRSGDVYEFIEHAIKAGMLEDAVEEFLQQKQPSAKLIELGETLVEKLKDAKLEGEKVEGEKKAYVLRNLANLCFDAGRKDEAEKYYRMAIDEYIELSKKDESKMSDLAKLFNNLGNLYHFMRRYDEAEEHYDWAVKIMKELGMRNELAIVLDNLGLLCFNLNKLDKAKEALEEALIIRKEMVEKDPSTVPELAKTLNNLGVLYKRLNKLEDVEKCYINVLGILRKLAAESSEFVPQLAAALNNLASLYLEENRDEEAENLVAEAMRYEAFLPPDIRMKCYINVAKVLEKRGDDAAGEYYFRAACLAFNLYRQYGYNSPNFVLLFEKAEKLSNGEMKGDAAIMKNVIMKYYYKVDTTLPEGLMYSRRGELVLKATRGEAMEFEVKSEEDTTAYLIARDVLAKVRK